MIEPAPTFSSAWTPEERLKLAWLVAMVVQRGIHEGTYGTDGHPNMQSIMDLVWLPIPMMEENRDSIEQLVEKEILDSEARAEFYANPLSDWLKDWL